MGLGSDMGGGRNLPARQMTNSAPLGTWRLAGRPRGRTMAVFVALSLACQPPGDDRPHITLGQGAAQLRDAFNADSGKVRVVMLVAPT